MSSSITSPSRPASLPGADGPSGAPQRGGPPVGDPDPGLHTGGRLGDRRGHDLAQVDVVGHGDRAGRTDRRDLGADPREPEVRVSSRSRSWPTRYQRPFSVTTPHGSTVRVVYGSARDGRCGNCTACRESMADNRIPSTSSDPRSPGTPAGDAMATWALSGIDVHPGGAQLEQCALRRGDQFG